MKSYRIHPYLAHLTCVATYLTSSPFAISVLHQVNFTTAHTSCMCVAWVSVRLHAEDFVGTEVTHIHIYTDV